MVYLAAAGFLDQIRKVYHILVHSSIGADNESASFFSGNDRCAVGIVQDSPSTNPAFCSNSHSCARVSGSGTVSFCAPAENDADFQKRLRRPIFHFQDRI